MSAEIERLLRDARPPLDAPEGLQARLDERLGVGRGGVTPSRWRPPRLSRGGRILAIAILVGAAGTAIAAGIIGLRSGSAPAVVTAQAATSWSRVEPLSDPIRFASPVPSAAVADDGHAVVTWERGGRIEMRRRPPGGPWAPVEIVSGGAQFATNPVVALAPNGRGAVLWRERRGGRELTLHLRDPEGRIFGTLRRRIGVEYVVLARSLDARTGRLGPRIVCSQPTRRRGDLKELSAGADGAGRVVAAWDRAGGVETGVLRDDGRWIPAVAVRKETSGRPMRVSLSVDRSGRAALAWISVGTYDPATPPASQITVVATTMDADGRWEPPRVIADRATNFNRAATAVDSDGRAVVVWTAFAEQEFPGFGGVVTAAVREPGGRWQEPKALSTAGRPAGGATVGFDGGGRAVALWSESPSGKENVVAGPGATTQASQLSAGTWSHPAPISSSGVERVSRARVPLVADGSGRLLALLPDRTGVIARTWTPGQAVSSPVHVVSAARLFLSGAQLAAGRNGTAVGVAFSAGYGGGRVVAFVREPARG